ncbi:MAG: glycosyltransferase family 10 domain-containing protein [Cytophagaceae bacterium]
MSKAIKIKFTDFWSGFVDRDSFLFHFLEKHFNVVLSEDPDFLIYSVWGNDFLKYDCIRIFHTMENVVPDFNECDYSFSFVHDTFDGKNYRLPNYVAYADPKVLLGPKDPEQILKSKTKFCNMVVSNPKAKKRIDFFHLLSTYKHIDSGGKYLNNIGGPIPHKANFIKDYKFTLAFENESVKGYTTEKLLEPMLVNSIPLYWGNPEVDKDFNTESFINYNDFANDKEFLDRIIEVDQNDKLYMDILSNPYFNNNQINIYFNEELLKQQFEKIFSSKGKIKPVAKTWKKFLLNKRTVTNYLRSIKRKIIK